MDYEKLHKDTIAKLQEMVNSGKITVEIARKICADFVPESEDEKVRKWIRKELESKYVVDNIVNNEMADKALAWLEKQSTPQVKIGLEWVNTIDDACDKRYLEEYAHGEYCHEQSFKWGFQEGVDWLEKQGEKDEEILILKDQIESLHAAIKAQKEAHKIELEKQGEPIDKIAQRARTEKQRVLVTESDGVANIDWDTRSLQDAKFLMEYGLNYIKKLEKQGEQKPVVNDNAKEMFIKALERVEEQNAKGYKLTDCDKNSWWEDFKNYTSCTIEQKPYMIQWKGDNLKEVIDFTGIDKNFEKWFKSFEEYEKYVNDHNGIFKLFNEDGSHYEVPVGAWIVKTPDGYNVASKAALKQNHAWSEEDEKHIMAIDLAVNRCDGKWNCCGEKCPISEHSPWLKSLRPQNRWKPSESDIRILEQVIDGTANPINYHATLHAILEKLKKLREE